MSTVRLQIPKGRRALASLLLLALGSLCALAPAAVAAVPVPAWKLTAATGPTNLPPKQSEVQRLNVQAEGGTFTLSHAKMSEGEAQEVIAEGHLTYSAGNPVATIVDGSFEVGLRITGSTIPGGTKIAACSTNCTTPGTTVTLSNAPTSAKTGQGIKIFTRKMTVLTGAFHVGDELSGVEALDRESLEPETKVTAVSGSEITVTNTTTSKYILGVTLKLSGAETTAPIPYNATAAQLQSALEALGGFQGGMFTVTGGPGGSIEDAFFITYGGAKFGEKNVEEFIAKSSLTGTVAFASVFTTLPGGPGTGEIGIFPVNIGGAATSGTTTVHLGPLPAGIVITAVPNGFGWSCSNTASEASCTRTAAVASLSPAEPIAVPVQATTATPFAGSAAVEVSGGAAAHPDGFQVPIVVSGEEAPAGAAVFWGGAFEADGTPAHQAGMHPFSALTYFVVNTVRTPVGQMAPSGSAKNITVDIPPGFLGNPMVTERCPQSEISCGVKVGALTAYTGFGAEGFKSTTDFSNDVPPFGYAAEFTTKVVSPLQSLLGSIRAEEDFGVRIFAPHAASSFEKLFKSYAVLEGTPAAAHGKPFLTLQSDCAEEARRQPAVKFRFDTWSEPGVFHYGEASQPPVTGCSELEFTPYNKKTKKGQVAFSFQPTSSQGSSPVGAVAHLHIVQSGLTDPAKLATPPLKRSVVTLPAGFSLNPSQANGLQACSEAQVGYKGPGALPNPTRFDEAPVSCPDGSKLGTVEAVSPLLEEPLKGTIYLAAQEENPFNSLIGLYLVFESPRFGITLKLPGRVDPDPVTGQLTATFDYNPQQPVEDLTLNLRGGGPRSELATPEVCGVYTTHGSWEPWSAPESGPPAQTEDSFEVAENCAESAAERFFEPSFEAGTTGTQAGAYSPLVIKVARNDGEQELKSLDFTLPKGLIGKLAGIATCSDAAIAAAAGKSGHAERSSPSCPASSRLGTIDTAAGVGSEPFHAQGSLYLAGPYKGAPLSSVVITPAVAGPFDLGNVVVRAPLYVNPESAQLTAKSDPIPTILKGIPLKVRSVAINVDRSSFIINPTSCEPMTVSASLAGGSGATATPKNRFQVGGCSNLKFGPKLKLALKGGTKRNSNPALTATLTQPAGQAGIGRVSVALPHSEFLDQSHIRTICTRVQFVADECPEAAIYGEAEAITPLLDQPLSGPVYLRSSSHRLPDLVVALKGPASQPIEIDLDGRIDSIHGGIRNTFELLPDAPISKFVLRMQGGKKGLLVNSTNLCRGTHKATVRMEGQNGKLASSSPSLTGQCKSTTKAKGHARSRSRLLALW